MSYLHSPIEEAHVSQPFQSMKQGNTGMIENEGGRRGDLLRNEAGRGELSPI